MLRKLTVAGALGTMALLAGPAVAAPVSYTFTTGPASFSPLPSLFATSISGSFVYDSAAPLLTTATNANFTNAFVYASTTPSGTFPYSGMTATIAGGGLIVPLTISDPRGSSTVSNDGFVSPPGTPQQDFMSLDADPFGPTGNHNISGFSVDGYTLWNMRMFWGEFTLGSDFLNNQDLPSTLPDGPARLALDFIPVGSEPTTPTTFVFYDNVTVTPTIAAIPEPETYAMLLAGLGVMAWLARRRRAAA